MALIYYFTFRFVIRRFDIKTPGRTEVTANANDKTDTESATEIIGLIQRDFSNSFSIKVMTSIVQKLENGFMVFLSQPLNDGDRQEHCLLSFKQQGVAGVIYSLR